MGERCIVNSQHFGGLRAGERFYLTRAHWTARLQLGSAPAHYAAARDYDLDAVRVVHFGDPHGQLGNLHEQRAIIGTAAGNQLLTFLISGADK